MVDIKEENNVFANGLTPELKKQLCKEMYEAAKLPIGSSISSMPLEQLPPLVQQRFSYKLLSVPVPGLIHNIPALKRRLRNGEKISWSNKIRLDISQEQVTLEDKNPFLNEVTIEFGKRLFEREDALTRNMLQTKATLIDCTGGTNGDHPTELTSRDIDTVIQTLTSSKAYTTSSFLGQDKFGPSPIPEAYLALANSEITGDLEAVQGFKPKQEYSSRGAVLDSEWGAVSRLRFLISNAGSVTPNASANGNDVYNIFCVGMGAYEVIEQDGCSAEFIYHPPIKCPVEYTTIVSGEFKRAPKILNDAWVINLRATLSN